MKYNKYSNKKVTIDGFEFDSRKEAKRYSELKLLLRAKKISNLILQPEFLLQESFKLNETTHRAIKYISDFQYEMEGKTIIEDCKGFKTDTYQLKKKLFLYKYGNEITFIES